MNPNEPNFGQLPPTPTSQPPVVPQQNIYGQYDVVPPLQPSASVVPNSGHNPYEFIMVPNTKPKHALLGGGQKSPIKLLAVVGGGAILLIIIGVIITSLIPSSSSTTSLTTIAQEQQEIMRVAQLGEGQATSETTRGLAYTVDLSVGTSQTKVLKYLGDHNKKLSVKELALKKDSSSDATLTAAQASNTYDSALEKLLTTQLQTYLSDLQQAYKTSSGAVAKSVIQSSFSAGKSLLSQAQAAQAQ